MDIEKVVPVVSTVVINGESLTIKPFKFAQLPKVFKLVQPIVDTLNGLQGLSKPALITTLIAEHGERVIELIMLVTGKDKAWAEDLDTDDGIRVLGAVLEVNYDFFIRAVMPAITGRISQIAQTGQTSS